MRVFCCQKLSDRFEISLAGGASFQQSKAFGGEPNTQHINHHWLSVGVAVLAFDRITKRHADVSVTRIISKHHAGGRFRNLEGRLKFPVQFFAIEICCGKFARAVCWRCDVLISKYCRRLITAPGNSEAVVFPNPSESIPDETAGRESEIRDAASP